MTEIAGTTGNAKNKDDEHSKYLETNFALVLCILYPITSWKNFVLALLDFGSKINAIYPTFVKELGLPIRLMDIST